MNTQFLRWEHMDTKQQIQAAIELLIDEKFGSVKLEVIADALLNLINDNCIKPSDFDSDCLKEISGKDANVDISYGRSLSHAIERLRRLAKISDKLHEIKVKANLEIHSAKQSITGIASY